MLTPVMCQARDVADARPGLCDVADDGIDQHIE